MTARLQAGLVALVVIATLLAGASAARAQEGVFVYTPDNTGNSVSVFRTNADGTLTAVTTITGVTAPETVTVRGDQAFAYVTLNTTNRLAVIDTATNTVVQTI